jgi:hypothetical protein
VGVTVVVRDRLTNLNFNRQAIMATASQETSDWVAAAMAGVKVKPGVKIAKEETGKAGTA